MERFFWLPSSSNRQEEWLKQINFSTLLKLAKCRGVPTVLLATSIFPLGHTGGMFKRIYKIYDPSITPQIDWRKDVKTRYWRICTPLSSHTWIGLHNQLRDICDAPYNEDLGSISHEPAASPAPPRAEAPARRMGERRNGWRERAEGEKARPWSLELGGGCRHRLGKRTEGEGWSERTVAIKPCVFFLPPKFKLFIKL